MEGSERLSGVAVAVAFGCLGTIGNLYVFVIFTIRLVTGMETDYGNFATLSLTATGIFISSYFSAMTVVSSLSTTFLVALSPGKGAVSESLCQFTGLIHVTCYMSTFLAIMFLALHRYLVIHNPVNYKKVVSKSVCAVAIGFVWAVSACWASSPFFGWGEYKKVPNWEIPLCLLHYSKSYSYVIVTAFGTSLLPILTTILCFWRCIKCLSSVVPAVTVTRSGSDLSVASDDTETEVSPTCSRHRRWTLTQSACLKADILIAVTFAVISLPLSIIILLPPEYQTSSLYWAIIIGSTYYSVQWVFICMYNADFIETKAWLKAKICQRKRESNNQHKLTRP